MAGYFHRNTKTFTFARLSKLRSWLIILFLCGLKAESLMCDMIWEADYYPHLLSLHLPNSVKGLSIHFPFYWPVFQVDGFTRHLGGGKKPSFAYKWRIPHQVVLEFTKIELTLHSLFVFSLILYTFNHQKLIRKCISSQVLKKWRYVLVGEFFLTDLTEISMFLKIDKEVLKNKLEDFVWCFKQVL